MTQFNVYFGTIGQTLGVKYKFTKEFKSEFDAMKQAKDLATTFYYKNEGKFGIPSFNTINKESEITGIPIEKLYEEHINDMIHFYVIPTELDTIPTKELKYNYKY